MARKLRLRFILVAMISVALVLVTIMTIVNVTNHASISQDADALLDILSESGGTFENMRFGGPEIPNGAQEEMPDKAPDNLPPNHFNARQSRVYDAETPFETRYFTLTYKDEGVAVNTNQIAAVNAQNAVEMAEKARKKGDTYGYIGDYRYKIDSANNMIIFLDCSRQLDTANAFLDISLIVSAAALISIFALVFFLSKAAVKPIVEAYNAQKRFVTEASHELKTPLTIISANNELQEIESGETASTKAIDHQVKRMTTMVKNMVALSRLDELEGLKDTQEMDLGACLEEQVDSMRAALEANDRKVTCDIADDLKYKGKEELIRQMMSIVLENASKYATSFVNIRLVKERTPVLTIENDAVDLEDGDMSKCFERFYRAPSARVSAEGSGIGLAMAKQIANLHHAAIEASAKDGVFKLTVVF